jgi:hypothetical protein
LIELGNFGGTLVQHWLSGNANTSNWHSANLPHPKAGNAQQGRLD